MTAALSTSSASSEPSDTAATQGRVITFYSYKGGTGRTMALANCACLLADGKVGLEQSDRAPHRVLMLDWDLEAPGLDLYFAPKADAERERFAARPGIIEYFAAVKANLLNVQSVSDDSARTDERVAIRQVLDGIDLDEYIVTLDIYPPNDQPAGALHLIKAGRRDDGMAERVAAFNWPALFDLAPSIFSKWAEDLAARYDFVLIDARTGLVDTSGICTMLMPDTLVAVFTPNSQSLDGLSELIRKAVEYRRSSDDLRALTVFPLPSRIEPSLPDLYRAWRLGGPPSPLPEGDGYQPRFQKVLAEVYGLTGANDSATPQDCDLTEYFDAVELQHVPDYAYGEPLPARTEQVESRLSLVRSYQEFGARLIHLEGPWQSVETAKAIRTISEAMASAQARLGSSEASSADDAIQALDTGLVSATSAPTDIQVQLALAHRPVVYAKLSAEDLPGAVALARRALSLARSATTEGAPERAVLARTLSDALARLAEDIFNDRNPLAALGLAVERLKLIVEFSAGAAGDVPSSEIPGSSAAVQPRFGLDESLKNAYADVEKYAENLRDVRRGLAGLQADTAEALLSEFESISRSLSASNYIAVARDITGSQVAVGDNNFQVIINHLPESKRAAADAALHEYLSTLWARLINLPLLAITRRGSGDEDVPLTAVYTPPDVTLRFSATATKRPGEERLHPSNSPAWEEEIELGMAGKLGDQQVIDRIVARLRERKSKGRSREQAVAFAAGDGPDGSAPGDDAVHALEALAAYPRLVLLGAPGSGKSTFARFVTLCMAGELLGRSRANLKVLNGKAESSDSSDSPWPHGVLFPLFVELRQFAASNAFPPADATGKAEHLLTYLRSGGPDKLPSAFADILADILKTGEALLILDGLDEVDESAKRRERLRAVVAGFAEAFPKVRILVTARPYAYEPGSPWRLDSSDFVFTSLSPFSDQQIGTFITRWYQRLVDRHQIDGATAERQKRTLKTAVRAHAYLRPLVEQPLLLTMIADVHAASGGALPAQRAEVYERSVELLLDRWNQNRGLVDEQDLAADLGLSVGDIRLALEQLADAVHGRAPSTDRASDIGRDELWAALNALRKSKGVEKADESRIMDYLQRRSGILVAESTDVYRFPHRSYQEFLAACTLIRDPGFPTDTLTRAVSDLSRWREVIRFVAGKSVATPVTYWSLIDGLVPDDPPAGTLSDGATAAGSRSASSSGAAPGTLPRGPGSPQEGGQPLDEAAAAELAYLSALSIDELETWRDVPGLHARKLERVRLWLEHIMVRGILAPADRADAGRILSILSDRRPGVGLHSNGVPWIDWVTIPEGTFIIGSDKQHDGSSIDDEQPREAVSLKAYRIARYPITVEQYGAFVENGGYGTDAYWTKAGLEWRTKGSSAEPQAWESQWDRGANTPVTGLTFFEAVAYCRWLTIKLREKGDLGADDEIWLPTEAQWEKAARGVDGRAFPWGDAFDAARATTSESGLGRPTPVGMYPLGSDDPWLQLTDCETIESGGPLDMSGNVWEWCVTQWRDTRDHADLEQRIGSEAAAYLEGSALRVVRGGSFVNVPHWARCAFRYWFDPDYRWFNRGFRVAAPVQL